MKSPVLFLQRFLHESYILHVPKQRQRGSRGGRDRVLFPFPNNIILRAKTELNTNP